MRNKIFSLTLFAFILILFLSSGVLGFFTKQHEFITLKSFETVSSPITEMCRPYLQLMTDSNTVADIFVLFYFSSDKQVSYLFTHQKGSFNKCLEVAGSDIEKKCLCYGIGSHQVQDFFSHNEGGMVSEYLRKNAGLNFLGHMIIEQNAMDKLFQNPQIANDPIITSGKLNEHDKQTLNSFFTKDGELLVGNDNLEFLSDITNIEGVDVENTAKIFRIGYLSKGFANTVYKDRVKLPFWMWGISIGMIIFGLVISSLVLIFGKTRWKYITALLWIIIFLIGLIILISFLTGTTWKITTFLLTVPPKLGYLSVSGDDTMFYYNKAQLASDEFFKTGQIPFDDASGLSYVDSKSGQFVKGSLIKAESTAKIIYMIILPILIMVLNVFLFLKSFRRKR